MRWSTGDRRRNPVLSRAPEAVYKIHRSTSSYIGAQTARSAMSSASFACKRGKYRTIHFVARGANKVLQQRGRAESGSSNADSRATLEICSMEFYHPVGNCAFACHDP